MVRTVSRKIRWTRTVIQISDADSFFSSLWQRVQTLEQTHRQNPLGVDLLVNSTKRYLSRPEYRIQLDELFAEETERLIEEIDTSVFTAQGGWDVENYRNKIALYESATEPLVRMFGVLGRWGDGSELSLVLDVIRAIYMHADKVGGGLTVWLNIRSYPAVLIFTAYGLGLVRAQRWNVLHRSLSSMITRQHHDSQRIVEALFLGSWKGGGNDIWRHLAGLEDRKTALSNHLLDLFLDWSKSFVGIPSDFERLFEHFEILASIVHLESTVSDELDRALADETGRVWVRMPVGRSGWHSSTREQVLKHIESDDIKKVLLEAAFAKGSDLFFDKSIANYRRIAGRMEW